MDFIVNTKIYVIRKELKILHIQNLKCYYDKSIENINFNSLICKISLHMRYCKRYLIRFCEYIFYLPQKGYSKYTSEINLEISPHGRYSKNMKKLISLFDRTQQCHTMIYYCKSKNVHIFRHCRIFKTLSDGKIEKCLMHIAQRFCESNEYYYIHILVCLPIIDVS